MVVSFVSGALERKFGSAQILPCAFAAERPGQVRHKVAGRGGSKCLCEQHQKSNSAAEVFSRKKKY